MRWLNESDRLAVKMEGADVLIYGASPNNPEHRDQYSGFVVLDDDAMTALVEWYTDGKCQVCWTDVPLGHKICESCWKDESHHYERAP